MPFLADSVVFNRFTRSSLGANILADYRFDSGDPSFIHVYIRMQKVCFISPKQLYTAVKVTNMLLVLVHGEQTHPFRK